MTLTTTFQNIQLFKKCHKNTVKKIIYLTFLFLEYKTFISLKILFFIYEMQHEDNSLKNRNN